MKKHKSIPRPSSSTVSSGEATGLIPALPETEAQAESYDALYPLQDEE